MNTSELMIRTYAREAGFEEITAQDFRAMLEANPWEGEEVLRAIAEDFSPEALYFKRLNHDAKLTHLTIVQAVPGTSRVKTIGFVMRPPKFEHYVSALKGDIPLDLLGSTSLTN